MHVGYAHMVYANRGSHAVIYGDPQSWHPDKARLLEILAKHKCEALNVSGGFTGSSTCLEMEQEHVIQPEPRVFFCGMTRISSAVTFLSAFSPTGMKKMLSRTFPSIAPLHNS